MIKRKQLDLEQLVKLPSLVAITPSWRGDKIAYYSNETGRNELYVMDLHSREVRQLTHGEAPSAVRSGFVWSRDDASIIFAKDHDGDEHHNLFEICLEDGCITQLNDDPDTQEHAVEIHPDNRTLTVASTRSGQFNVHLLDLQAGTWTQLTQFNRPAEPFCWSPDGNWLAVATNETADLKNQDGYLISKDGREIRKVLDTGSSSKDTFGKWHPNGECIAFTSDVSGVSQPGVLHVGTGDIRWFGQP